MTLATGDMLAFASTSGSALPYKFRVRLDGPVSALSDNLAKSLPALAAKGFKRAVIRGPWGDIPTPYDLQRPPQERLMNFDTLAMMPEHDKHALLAQWDHAIPELRAQGVDFIWYVGTWGHHLADAWQTATNRPGIMQRLWEIGEWLVQTGCPVIFDHIAARRFDAPDHPFLRFVSDIKSAGIPCYSEAIHSAGHTNREWLDELDGSCCFERRWTTASQMERVHAVRGRHIRMYANAEDRTESVQSLVDRITECMTWGWIPAIGTVSAELIPSRMQLIERASIWRPEHTTPTLWRQAALEQAGTPIEP